MQIYKHIPIITAQPTKADFSTVPHFLYNFAKNDYNLSFGKWLKMLQNTLLQIKDRNVIIVGGTMMYAYLLLNGYSNIPEIPDSIRKGAENLYNEVGHDSFLQIVKERDDQTPQDKQRVIYNYCLLEHTGFGLHYYKSLPQTKFFNKGDVEIIIPQKTRAEVYQACDNRFIDMIQNGLIEEVDSVMNMRHLPIKRATGFINIANYISGNMTKDDMINKCQQETRNYAKRQIIWLRKFAKECLLDINQIKNL